MADVKLRIQTNGDSTASRIEVSSNKSHNNIGFSTTPISYDDSFKGTELLSWATGSLSFNNEGKLANGKTGKTGQLQSESNPRQFVWGATNSAGEYSITLTLTASSGTFDKIVLVGDKEANQFPTQAILDGEIIYSDDSYWVIDLGDQSQSHTIQITKWNRPNYNACLNIIKIMLQYLDIDKSNGLKSVEFLSQLIPNEKEISFGVCPSSGSAEIIDIDGEIYDLVNDGVIQKANVPIELYINNKLLIEGVTTGSSYSPDKTFTIQFSDVLNSLDSRYYEGYPLSSFDLKNGRGLNSDTFIEDMLKSLGYSDAEISTICTSKVYNDYYYISTNPSNDYSLFARLQAPTMLYGFVDKTYWRPLIDKILQGGNLGLFMQGSLPKLVSARPIKLASDKVIVIPKHCQFSTLDSDVFLKTKADKINVEIFNYDKKYKPAFQSSTIYAYDDSFNYIGEDPGVNDPSYNISKVGDNQNFTLTIDLSTLSDKSIAFDKNSIEFIPRIKITKRKKYYTLSYSTEEQIIDLQDYEWSVSNNVLTINSLTRIYTDQYIPDDNENYVLDYSVEVLLYGVELQGNPILSFGNGENIHEIIGNDLLQVTSGSTEDAANRLLFAYKDGLRSASLTVCCADYYDIDGIKQKDWTSGDTINVGDIITVIDDDGQAMIKRKDGFPIYWKVTSSNFRYDGQPLLDLRLIETVIATPAVWIQANTVSTPAFALIISSNNEAGIYYTTDGSEPTINSDKINNLQPYSNIEGYVYGTFNLPNVQERTTVTIKARAIRGEIIGPVRETTIEYGPLN